MFNEWEVIWRLGVALALSSCIGIEREMRQKSAGLRTYTLVGLGSALFVLVSKYGFFDVLQANEVILDPSRVAAQIVSGIGFIGAGLIFVRRDAVRGLTTAAGVWLTAAVGAAAGAGLPILAIATTVAYLIVAYVYPGLMAWIPASGQAPSALRVVYEDGRGVLRDVLTICTGSNFSVADIAIDRPQSETQNGDRSGSVSVRLEVHGTGSVAQLAAQVEETPGVLAVSAGDANEIFD
ncbi:MAG TPA: MgtC/SapB family protein [Solirubrobacterales bacterium]|jgi:putative Mg2+ transporter-C (MgtC) family protein